MKALKVMLLGAALVAGLSASAQTAKLTAEESAITVAKGATFDLVLDLNLSFDATTSQIWIKAPEGINVTDPEEIDTPSSWWPSKKAWWTATDYAKKSETRPHDFLLAYASTSGIKAGNGEFLTIPMIADIDAGTYTIKVDEIMFNSPEVSVKDMEGFAVTLTVTDKSGIQNVEMDANEADAPYYDLMGRKVANPVAGVYVRAGKKVLVK